MSFTGGRLILALSSLVIVIACASRTHAEASAADKAAAAALFTEGLHLLDQQRTAEACPKFEESHKLDPAAGTALNLGDCFEQLGRTASAYGAFDEAAALARRAGDLPREDEARRRKGALEPRLSKITVIIPASSRIDGLTVLRDGRLLGAGQWGQAVPVDPGNYTLEARAPGRRPWKTTVQVAAVPGAVQVTVPELPMDKPLDVEPQGHPGRRIAGIVVGGVGVAGLAVGGGFAIAAAVKNEESFKYCLPDDHNKCYAKGVVLRNESIRYADTSTVVVSLGAVAASVGTALFLTAGSPRPSDRSARVWVIPQISPHTAGLGFGAAW